MPRRVGRYSSDEDEIVVDSDNSMQDFLDDDDVTEDESDSSDGNSNSQSTNNDDILEYTLVDEPDSGITRSSNSATLSPAVLSENEPGPSHRMPRTTRASTGRGRQRSARVVHEPANNTPQPSNGDSDEVPNKKIKLEEQQFNNVAFTSETPDENSACCSICFDEYESEGPHRVTSLKCCGHLFGKSCIERWIKTDKNKNCPTCKKTAKPTDILVIFLGEIGNGNNAQIKTMQDEYKLLEDKAKNLQQERDAALEEVKELKILYSIPVVEDSFKFKILKSKPYTTSNTKASRSFSWDPNSEFIVTTFNALKSGISKISLASGKRDTITTGLPASLKIIQVCPFNPRLVASVSPPPTEKCDLFIHDFSKEASVKPFMVAIDACKALCWENDQQLVIGTNNGALKRYTHGMKTQENLLDGYFDVPINMVAYDKGHRTFIVATSKNTYAHRPSSNSLPTKLIASDFKAQIESCHYDNKTSCFLLTLSPNKDEPLKLELYKVNFGQTTFAEKIRERVTDCKKQAQIPVNSYFWQRHQGNLMCSYFDPSRTITRVFNWGKLDDVNGLECKPKGEVPLVLDFSGKRSMEPVKQLGVMQSDRPQSSGGVPNENIDLFLVQTSNELYPFHITYEH
ncbi:hypothetical protein M3Y97_00160700 [Aphelenchoides bicaudatus]|nr:hypothetical protein M3Y97_00160700 [Aphelenchoides bicaudatus]